MSDNCLDAAVVSWASRPWKSCSWLIAVASAGTPISIGSSSILKSGSLPTKTRFRMIKPPKLCQAGEGGCLATSSGHLLCVVRYDGKCRDAAHQSACLDGDSGRHSDYQAVLRAWRDLPMRSYNFQLHPPVGKDSNIATNNCGNLELPLMFLAHENEQGQMEVDFLQPAELPSCRLIESARARGA
jgi:hypothetical protein